MNPLRRIIRGLLFLPIHEAEAREARIAEGSARVECTHQALLVSKCSLETSISTTEALLNDTLRKARGERT